MTNEKRKDEVSQENKIEELSKKTGFFIAVIGIPAPGAYLMGVAFHQGWLNGFGVLSDSFPISVQDSYVNAYLAGILIIFEGWLVLSELGSKLVTFAESHSILAVLAVVAFSISIYFVFKAPKKKHLIPASWSDRGKKIIAFLHWKNNDFTKALGVTGLASYIFVVFLYIWALAALVLMIFPYSAFEIGKKSAVEKRDLFIEKGCFSDKREAFINCHTLKDKEGKVLVEGLLIAHSGNIVAFFTKKGSHVTNFADGSVLGKRFFGVGNRQGPESKIDKTAPLPSATLESQLR